MRCNAGGDICNPKVRDKFIASRKVTVGTVQYSGKTKIIDVLPFAIKSSSA